MGRGAWICLALLVVTNAMWLALWVADEPEPALFDEDTEALHQKIDALQEELTQLRHSEPALLGMGEAPAARDADADADANAPAAGTGDEPSGGRATADGDSPEQLAAREAARRDADQKAQAQKTAYAAAQVKAAAMMRKVMQVEDPALRREGLAEISDALAGDDPHLVEYALSVLHSLRAVEFERGAFIGLVEGHLDSENGGIRRSALYAMAAVDPENVDIRRLIDSAGDEDPRVRGHTARLLALTGGKKFEGEAADTVLTLLSDENANVRKGTLRGLSGAEMTPDLERRLVEMSVQGDERGDAVYFGLSQMKDKSRPVVDALLTCLEDENHRIRSRAHWGLQRGVSEAQQFYVAQQYAGRLGKFLNPKSHNEALKLIVRYGDGSLAPELERFAGNELVDPKVRELARKAADYLATKKPR